MKEALKAVPIPENKIEAREAIERRELVKKAFHEMLQDLHEIDKLALRENWSEQAYNAETEKAIAGLREAFPQSAAVQEGLSAIALTTNMIVAKTRLDRAQESRRFSSAQSGRITDAVRKDLFTTVLWQQHVASFLAGHASLASLSKQPDSVHAQLMTAISKRTERAHDLGNDVFGTPVITEKAKYGRDQMWQSAIGMASTAQFFQGQGYDVHWADPEHDVFNGIDLFASGDQEEFAIQLKTVHPSKTEQSEMISTDDSDSFSYDPELHRDLVKTDTGVKRYNQTEGRHAIGLMLRLKFDTNQIDPRAGVLQKSARKFLQDQLDPIIAKHAS